MDDNKELKEEMQLTGFNIIAIVGSAKSSFMEAVALARDGEIDPAKAKIEEGESYFAEAHHQHADLIQKEAQGVDLPFSLILMHAEDQLLTTEVIKFMALELIEIYSRLKL